IRTLGWMKRVLGTVNPSGRSGDGRNSVFSSCSVITINTSSFRRLKSPDYHRVRCIYTILVVRGLYAPGTPESGLPIRDVATEVPTSKVEVFGDPCSVFPERLGQKT